MKMEEEIRRKRLELADAIELWANIKKKYKKAFKKDELIDIMPELATAMSVLSWFLDEGFGIAMEKYISWAKNINKALKGEQTISGREWKKELKDITREGIEIYNKVAQDRKRFNWGGF
ncbi:unnamed protein product [marine sediment metagenome]|uniref:Uncharacterized protein n=1 Tax=marine sediment metagenome TaxID=412755 RepID=X1ERV4_9ZZZZ